MSTWQEQDLLIPADHPSAPGHFPGRPIIPGALLLDAILAAIAPAGPVTIRGVKFLRPVPHGTDLRLRWQAGAPVRFECVAPAGLVLSGTLTP
jgi:3-hydroxyacyl-[acyl-carrier-protein] dehydratase